MVIYSDSIIIEREWLPKISFPGPVTVIKSLDAYERDTSPYKIAFTAHRLHVENDRDIDFFEKMDRLSSCSQLVFSLESELHFFHWELWDRCHRDNVYWLLPGLVNDRPDFDHHIIYWGDWFKTTANLYRQLPDVTAQYRPYEAKPKFFDALLGSPKPHRDFVSRSVRDHGLEEKFIIPYGGQWNDRSFYARDYFIYEPGTEVIEKDSPGTCGYAKYHGILCHLSQIIPTEVFNNTAYSIVAETDFDNTLSFFSEKTAKPMIYRRLFVAFSGYKFLHNLRKLGFRTFGDVIDESYDDIKHNQQRLAAAFEQVKTLCAMDQRKVLDTIKPIIDHNHELIMQTDWTRFAGDKVQHLIRTKMPDVG